MKYYEYPDEYSSIEPGVTYMEVNEGWVIREITFNGEDYLASNRSHPLQGMGLPEGYTNYDELVAEGEVTAIAKEEFEAVWQAYLTLYQTEWEAAKQAYRIGMTVRGWIHIFYPQGVIINLGTALAVADYQACKASTQPEFMYPSHRVTAVVSGYDEENQWIILDSPQVHQEQVH